MPLCHFYILWLRFVYCFIKQRIEIENSVFPDIVEDCPSKKSSQDFSKKFREI